MCLDINRSKHPTLTPYIAKADMTVWKIIFDDNTSLHEGFMYSPHTTYSLAGSLTPSALWEIHEGFHAYRDYDACKRYIAFSYERKIVKYIIPKGAQFFFGLYGDIVSNKIRSGNLNGE